MSSLVACFFFVSSGKELHCTGPSLTHSLAHSVWLLLFVVLGIFPSLNEALQRSLCPLRPLYKNNFSCISFSARVLKISFHCKNFGRKLAQNGVCKICRFNSTDEWSLGCWLLTGQNQKSVILQSLHLAWVPLSSWSRFFYLSAGQKL